MPETATPTKIAILGGGLGALSAAFALTSQQDWQSKYEITVYQLGWRLGGKGASGRNAQMAQRIEEHGLHMFFGFYENAFRLMQCCYAELNREPSVPLATWSDAFKAAGNNVMSDLMNGQWDFWRQRYEQDSQQPGTGTVPTYWDMILRMLATLKNMWGPNYPTSSAAVAGDGNAPGVAATDKAMVEHIEASLQQAETLAKALQQADTLATATLADAAMPELHSPLVDLLLRWLRYVRAKAASLGQNFHYLRAELDLFTTMLIGILEDGLLSKGFDVVNNVDISEWLRGYGASDAALDAPQLRASYQAVFAVPFDPSNPRSGMEAGTALRASLRLNFGYNGSFMWKMQAGMGDTVFAPLYQVLTNRGVTFAFFHAVRKLHVKGGSIDSIDVGQQVTVQSDPYNPLVTVKGLPCWPDAPCYEQLVEGEALQQYVQKNPDATLESYWTTWQDVKKITLKCGEDFDKVILGIPLGALPAICGELIQASDAWRQMVDKVQTTRTMAFQLWLTPTLRDLDWKLPYTTDDGPVVGAYVQPFDTYADMTHLYVREAWPDAAADTPQHIAYFCDTLDDSPPDPPQYFNDPEFPTTVWQKVLQLTRDFLSTNIKPLWPRGVQVPSGVLNWDLLVDLAGGKGEDRLNAQYIRANIDPNERYVLSVPGSSQYRLKSDGSGFANLWLAGDWTANGLNVGCAEAAVMSGFQASRAICGCPTTIAGETDSPMAS